MIKKCKNCGKAFSIHSKGATMDYGPECAKHISHEELLLESLFDDNMVEYNDPFTGDKVRIDKALDYDLRNKESIRKWLGVGGETQQGITLLKFMVDGLRDPKGDHIPDTFKTILNNMLNNQLKKDHKTWVINSLLAEVWQYMGESGREVYSPDNIFNRVVYRTMDEWISLSKRKDWVEVVSNRNRDNFNLFIDKLKRRDF